MKRPRVEIEWEDSSGPATGVWHRLNDYDHSPSRCRTLGYVVKETKRYVVVASSVSDADSLSGLITIPKSAIRKRKRRS